MEQSGGYWMWTRSSSNLMNMSDQRKSVHDDQSWEEQAFAEDSAGHLGGGCVWPPRSYTCSFCRREFRSAQALGGHMNVHRRDRARLKQYPLLTHDHNHPPPHINQTIVLDHQNPFTSLSTGIVQNPSQVCSTSLVFNPSPKSNPRFAAPPPPRVVSASSTQEDYSNTNKQLTKSLVSPSYSSPIVHESLFSNPTIRSEHSIMPTRFLIVSGSSKHNEEDERLKEMANTRLRIHDDGECIELNPSVSLSLVSRCVSRSRGGLDVDDDDHEDGVDEGMLGKKRRRTDEESSLPPFFLNDNFVNRNIRLKSEELLGLKQSSIMEELDLELRLGDQPAAKVK